jgi:hypothetical protein
LALGGRGEVEWMLKWGFVPWLVSNEWGGRRGVYILNSEKLVVTVQKTGFIRTSDTGSELPRGAVETQQWSHIGSFDHGSVLSRPWLKLANEAILVLPTQCWYYLVSWKKEEQLCMCRLDSHSLRSPPKALLASLSDQFASPFIVRCFLYSNSKSKIN